MNDLTGEQIAWLAGVYEGEGSCSIRGRSVRIEIVMTDRDIITRINELCKGGTVRGPITRDPSHKPTYHWGIGGINAVKFLEAVMPWLGKRRRARAASALEAWNSPGRQTRVGDTLCTYGHELTPENSYETYGGRGRGCKVCRKETNKRYRESHRDEIRARRSTTR